MKRVVSIAAALAVTASAHAAFAHRIDGHVSSSGLEFLQEQVPSLVPSQLDLPEASGSFSCLEAAQRDTSVDLEIHDVVLATPHDGVIRLEIELSADAQGELYLNGCGLDTTCQDQFSLSRGRAAIEFQLEVSEGQPQLVIHDVELLVDEEDIQVELSDCAIGSAANLVIGAVKSLAMDLIVDFIADTAAEELSPLINGLLGGFLEFEGHFGPTDMQASLIDVHASTDGLRVAADVALQSTVDESAACLGGDRPAPETQEGFPPSLTGGTPAHLAVAVNLGLVDDALYNVWRAGLMCLKDTHFAALGVDLKLDYHLGKLLPGFPPNTAFGLELRVTEPPRIEASSSDGALLEFVGRGIEVDLIGRHADGVDTIHVVADVDAMARLDINRDTGQIVLRLEGVEIHRLEVDDTVGGEPLGVDAALLAHMFETYVVPSLTEELGEVPVTGSIIGYEDNYVLLRDVFTEEGYLAAKVDLFRAPESDTGRPTVAIASRPDGLVSAEDSVLSLTGSDPEIPAELLRYRVVVDGEERPLSFVRDVQIGAAGTSTRHQVEVSAVDLAGNEDPDPITLAVDVDGVAPTVEIEGGGIRDASGATASIAWRQSDDLTASGELVPRVLLYRVRDPSNILDVELVEEFSLEPGATSYEVPLGAGDLYRVEVRVADGAGNEGVGSTTLSVRAGGCAVSAGSGSGPVAALILALGALGLLRLGRRPIPAARARG